MANGQRQTSTATAQHVYSRCSERGRWAATADEANMSVGVESDCIARRVCLLYYKKHMPRDMTKQWWPVCSSVLICASAYT